MKKAGRFKPARWSYPAGMFFFSLFLVLAICWQSIFQQIKKSQFQLDPSSTMYKMWVKNPLPIYLEIYLYNITNAEELLRNKTVVPNFKEVGPFLFEESREKVGITWNDNTVTFNQSKKWILLQEKSEDFSISVTNLNPIASTIAHISRLWQSKLQREIANALINLHEPLLVTATARQWLFDGIPDKFLEIFEALRTVTDIPIPYNKFGWFYDRNVTSYFDGVFTINTGKFNLRDVGMMVTWNNMNKTEHYEDECALVYGSSGEIIPPLAPSQQNLSVFASDICSYITLKRSGTTVVEGINSYEYVGDESAFDNGTLYPENTCFYLGESCPSGCRNVSTCRYGSPAFLSFPHFYLADPDYAGKISGMNPDESKHKFRLKVEPKTGTPLEVDGSFQINFRVESYPWCDAFRGLPKMYIPMLWFKQMARITPEYAVSLKFLLFFDAYGEWLFYGLSFLIAFFIIIVPCTRMYKEKGLLVRFFQSSSKPKVSISPPPQNN